MPLDRYPRAAAELVDLRHALKSYVIGPPSGQPIIGPTTRVRAQGSCFAENIARALLARGVETSFLTVVELVNTPLANRVFFEHLLDPTRPYALPEHQELMPPERFGPIRDALPTEDVFIFTLGVAPCWYRVGEATPCFHVNPQRVGEYEMRHTSVAENEAAIRFVIQALRRFNPAIKVVLTVSPVPLNRGMGLGSTVEADCISKSTLRVAVANVMNDRTPGVIYWPSFEIVRWIAPHLTPAYGADDGYLRHVNKDLIDLIVSLFLEHYAAPAAG